MTTSGHLWPYAAHSQSSSTAAVRSVQTLLILERCMLGPGPWLTTVHAAAGYFDAPAAPQCPLLHMPMEPLPPVTMVFCALEGVPAMKVHQF